MFVLRSFTPNGVEGNVWLGESYSLILRSSNPDAFVEICNKFYIGASNPPVVYNISTAPPLTYGFVVNNSTSDMFALAKDERYYIMSSDGQTFDNISYKG